MKCLTKVLLAMSLLVVAGCSKPKEEVVEEEVTPVETVVANDFYKDPLMPTAEQITLFNELSNKMKSGTASEEEQAVLVAKNFSMQFFTFAGKTSRNDVGGLMYIPSSMQEEFKSYAQAYFYSHFEELEGKYGKDELPYVTSVETSNVVAKEVPYKDVMYNGYTMDVTLTYKENKSSKSEQLRTTYTITLCKAEDYKDVQAVEEYLNSLGDGVIADQEHPSMMKSEIYRVLSISE